MAAFWQESRLHTEAAVLALAPGIGANTRRSSSVDITVPATTDILDAGKYLRRADTTSDGVMEAIFWPYRRFPSAEPARPAARPGEGRKIHQGTSHAKRRELVHA
jgi:hypothetical protein